MNGDFDVNGVLLKVCLFALAMSLLFAHARILRLREEVAKLRWQFENHEHVKDE